MSCEDFENDIVDLARGEEIGEAARGQALGHADECPRCAGRLEDERAVTSVLRSLAARTAGAEAPPRVEAALRHALREPGRAGAGGNAAAGPSRAIELLLLAAAAAILAAIVVVPPRVGRFPEPAPMAAPAGAPTMVSGPEGATVPAAENAEFVSLTYGEDLRELDSLQVVSVELPRTALAALGWPSADNVQTGSVTAEVIVGHDGVARAIRFVD
jgi:hypothetical protein